MTFHANNPRPEVASPGASSPSGPGAGGAARPPAPVTDRVQYPNRLRDIVGDVIGAASIFVVLFGGLILGWALGW